MQLSNAGFPGVTVAASFALLAHASAYLKCRVPAVFARAILNVQPMGFYSTEVFWSTTRGAMAWHARHRN